MGSLKLWLLLATWCAGAAGAAGADDGGCSKFVFLAKAEQSDQNGLRCWDHVSVSSCGGRCESRQVSDWMFPFKESRHPVCMFSSWRPVEARLRHCDEGVATGTDIFQYVSASECRCEVCSSESTSCEWLPPNSHLLEKLVAESDN